MKGRAKGSKEREAERDKERETGGGEKRRNYLFKRETEGRESLKA